MLDFVWYWWSDYIRLHSSCTYDVSWCRIYVVSRNGIPADYLLRMLPMYQLGNIASLILEVYHGVQLMSMPRYSTYHQLFLNNTWDNLAGPIPAPDTTCFVVGSNELLNSKHGWSATGAERPILIPLNKYRWDTLMTSIFRVRERQESHDGNVGPQLIRELRNQERKRYWWMQVNHPDLSVEEVTTARLGTTSNNRGVEVELSSRWYRVRWERPPQRCLVPNAAITGS